MAFLHQEVKFMPTRIKNNCELIKQEILQILATKLAVQEQSLQAEILANAELLNDTRKHLVHMDKSPKIELEDT